MAIVSSRISGDEDKDIGPRTKMRDDLWEATKSVIDAHPEIHLLINVVLTPRPDDHPRDKSYDDSHTSLQAGDVELTTEQLQKFLLMAIEQLATIYNRIAKGDQTLIDKMSKGK